MSRKYILIGNPNTGKTTLFNALTGLNQKTGNFHGVTVEHRVGKFTHKEEEIEIIDLPGTYSLAPKSKDEAVVLDYLLRQKVDQISGIVIVADATNLKKNLFLMHQARELNLPIILVVNMMDLALKKGFKIDLDGISRSFNIKCIGLNARKKDGVDHLKSLLIEKHEHPNYSSFFIENIVDTATKEVYSEKTYPFLSFIEDLQEQEVKTHNQQHILAQDTIKRYNFLRKVIDQLVTRDLTADTSLTNKIDRFLLHKVWGFITFTAVLALMFQAIFSWSSYPMDWIDSSFSQLSQWGSSHFPSGPFFDLISEGLIPGIGGIVIFIPQIVILFTFLVLLEESGYMSRVIVLMDSLFKKFGLNGQSIIPLISGTACAIPAIMATRSISDWKQRLITILITPFTTCSARLPVYVILIAIAVPEGSFLGLSLQAWSLLFLYFIGFASALISAFILNKVLKIEGSRNFLAIELPTYKWPVLKNVLWVMVDKTKAFVLGAGKIILSISIVLWVLGNYGPNDAFEQGRMDYEQLLKEEGVSEELMNAKLSSYSLENSYLGILGKSIEPAIEPLGLDWKIGIGLISSFAAREVFNSTMITIYSVENPDDESSLLDKIRNAQQPDGTLVFNTASSWGLLIFYAFALQCMSTLAIVVKETGSYKWAIYQFVGLGIIAYILSFLTYQILK